MVGGPRLDLLDVVKQLVDLLAGEVPAVGLAAANFRLLVDVCDGDSSRSLVIDLTGHRPSTLLPARGSCALKSRWGA